MEPDTVGGVRRYSDAQLIEAIKASRSWRGVLRELGLAATSSTAMRSVRTHADRLGLDYRHFTGQRRWSDLQLVAAIASAATWTQVAEKLGLASGSSIPTIRGHAVRLGIDTAHLVPVKRPRPPVEPMRPELRNLSKAGSLLAAAWFELCGHSVSWPLEPNRYDLLVWIGSTAERIQVKTTTVKQGTSWTVWISSAGKTRTTYDPDDIDYFFVIDGDFDYYLILVAAVGGLTAIRLSAYADYKLSLDDPRAGNQDTTDRRVRKPRSPEICRGVCRCADSPPMQPPGQR